MLKQDAAMVVLFVKQAFHHKRDSACHRLSFSKKVGLRYVISFTNTAYKCLVGNFINNLFRLKFIRATGIRIEGRVRDLPAMFFRIRNKQVLCGAGLN